jgi:hypothetical protein
MVVSEIYPQHAPRGNVSERAEVVRFLKDHVIGRTVAMLPMTAGTDPAWIEEVYEDQTSFSNLVETTNGFRFDLTMTTKLTRYRLDQTGKRKKPGRNYSVVQDCRYEVSERKSTGKLVGFRRLLSSTAKDDSFSDAVVLVRMRLQGGTLVVQETEVSYDDSVKAEGPSKVVTSDSETRYVIKDGKLEVHSGRTTFDVDPETLQRTKEKFQTQFRWSENRP